MGGGGARKAAGDLPRPTDDAAQDRRRYRRRLQAAFWRPGGTSLISCCRVDGMRHPRDMYRKRADGHGELFIADPHDRTTRHDYEELYQRNGAIYMVSLGVFSDTKRGSAPSRR